jgi:hypothetical protein
VRGRFVELVPNRRIVQLVEFDSEDAAFAGTMRMKMKLTPASAAARRRSGSAGSAEQAFHAAHQPGDRVIFSSRPDKRGEVRIQAAMALECYEVAGEERQTSLGWSK